MSQDQTPAHLVRLWNRERGRDLFVSQLLSGDDDRDVSVTLLHVSGYLPTAIQPRRVSVPDYRTCVSRFVVGGYQDLLQRTSVMP